MPAGLQIMDASSNVMLDTTKSIGRITGSAVIGDDPFTGTITVPGYASPATVWFFAQFDTGSLGDPPNLLDFGAGSYSISGGVITWEAYTPTKIVYGVY